jgi:hypothetical protein
VSYLYALWLLFEIVEMILIYIITILRKKIGKVTVRYKHISRNMDNTEVDSPEANKARIRWRIS